MVNKKVIACIAMMAMTASVVSGCGKKGPTKAELQNTVTALSNKNTAYEDTIKQLKMVIANYNKNESVVQDLDSYFTLAANDNAYVNLDGKVNIAYPLEIKPNRTIQDETLLYLTSTVQFVPNANWNINCGSGHMKMSHTSDVYGEVDCYTYIGSDTTDNIYPDYIEKHFEALHAEEVGSASSIFLANGNLAGKQATARLKVATFPDGTLQVPNEEEMQTEAESVAESVAEATGESNAAESVAESTAETVAETSAAAESSEATGESTAPETDANGNVIETTESAPAETEPEVQMETKNYLYTVAVAMYKLDDYSTQVVSFKFFYPEGDASDVSTKQEFISGVIKSFTINGNSLTLQ